MSITSNLNNIAYGLNQPGVTVFPSPVVANRAPTTADHGERGQTWVDTANNTYYVLTNYSGAGLANWQLLAAGAGDFTQITTNAGVVMPVGGNVNLVGGGATNITTSGAGATATVAVISSPSFAGTTTVATGLVATTGNIVATAGQVNAGTSISAGTSITAVAGNITASAGNIIATLGAIEATIGLVSAGTSVTAGTTVTAGTGLTVSSFGVGVVQSNGAGVFSSTAGTNGQLLIGNTAGAPAWATITAGANITVTNGANSITIAANAGAATLNYTSTAVTPYVVAASDDYVSIDASGGAKQVNLPNAPATGRIFIVKDQKGNAAANNITVTTVGGAVNIDGATTKVLTTNYQSIQVIFNGTSYEIY